MIGNPLQNRILLVPSSSLTNYTVGSSFDYAGYEIDVTIRGDAADDVINQLKGGVSAYQDELTSEWLVLLNEKIEYLNAEVAELKDTRAQLLALNKTLTEEVKDLEGEIGVLKHEKSMAGILENTITAISSAMPSTPPPTVTNASAVTALQRKAFS